MKQLLLLFVFATTLFACKKDKLADAPVAGSWTWQESVGGFSGSDTIKPGASNTIVLTFTNNLKYKLTLNSQLVSEGTYNISAPADLPIIQFSNLPASSGLMLGTNGVSFNKKNNTLTLRDEYISEGYTHYFIMSADQ